METLADQRKKKIVEFIRDFSRVKHYPPTIREIGAGIGIKSTSLISYYIDGLVSDGVLGKEANLQRAVWVKEK